MKMEQTQRSETLAFKLQTPVNHPEESVQQSEHGESLKLRSELLNTDSQRFSNNTTSMAHIHESLMCLSFDLSHMLQHFMP
jgi:hypothetical protein